MRRRETSLLFANSESCQCKSNMGEKLLHPHQIISTPHLSHSLYILSFIIKLILMCSIDSYSFQSTIQIKTENHSIMTSDVTPGLSRFQQGSDMAKIKWYTRKTNWKIKTLQLSAYNDMTSNLNIRCNRTACIQSTLPASLSGKLWESQAESGSG